MYCVCIVCYQIDKLSESALALYLSVRSKVSIYTETFKCSSLVVVIWSISNLTVILYPEVGVCCKINYLLAAFISQTLENQTKAKAFRVSAASLKKAKFKPTKAFNAA